VGVGNQVPNETKDQPRCQEAGHETQQRVPPLHVDNCGKNILDKGRAEFVDHLNVEISIFLDQPSVSSHFWSLFFFFTDGLDSICSGQAISQWTHLPGEG